MTKTIMILAIAVAFVAGSIATGSIAYAVPNGGWQEAVEDLQSQIDAIPADPQGILGFYQTTDARIVTQADVDNFELHLTPTCDNGDFIMGAGGAIVGPNGQIKEILLPSDPENQEATTVMTDYFVGNAAIGYAICADFDPAH